MFLIWELPYYRRWNKDTFFNFSSKLKDCSLKHIGELSFDISENFKCIGIPTTTKESDELLLVDPDADHSYLYVKILFIIVYESYSMINACVI